MSPPEVAALAARLTVLERQHRTHETTCGKILAAIADLGEKFNASHRAYCNELTGLREFIERQNKKGKSK
jgi:hypothetical protein